MKYHIHTHIKRNQDSDQTKYMVKTHDHESMDLEVVRLLSRVCALHEEGHTSMDYPFVPFHIKVGIVKHVELQNVAGALMDQP
jgi:hypothetical protein